MRGQCSPDVSIHHLKHDGADFFYLGEQLWERHLQPGWALVADHLDFSDVPEDDTIHYELPKGAHKWSSR